MKKNNHKAKVISIKTKEHTPELTHPLMSQQKKIDSMLDEVVNAAGQLDVKKVSVEEYDNMMDSLMKLNMLVGGMHYMITDMKQTELDGKFMTECNMLRQQNKELKEAVLHHKKCNVESVDVKNVVTELLVEALETLQPY